MKRFDWAGGGNPKAQGKRSATLGEPKAKPEPSFGTSRREGWGHGWLGIHRGAPTLRPAWDLSVPPQAEGGQSRSISRFWFTRLEFPRRPHFKAILPTSLYEYSFRRASSWAHNHRHWTPRSLCPPPSGQKPAIRYDSESQSAPPDAADLIRVRLFWNSSDPLYFQQVRPGHALGGDVFRGRMVA